eukprot:6953543-Alexandrium_andersonii.AAC.1
MAGNRPAAESWAAAQHGGTAMLAAARRAALAMQYAAITNVRPAILQHEATQPVQGGLHSGVVWSAWRRPGNG